MRGILSTDEYQLTMAQLYLRAGLADRRVRFEHFFRRNPDYGTHQAGYCVSAGLGDLARWVGTTRATPADVEALRGHRGRTGQRLFGDDFLTWFADAGFSDIDVHAVAEGRVVHPNTPMTVVEGPLAAAQLLETPLLNALNFPTLIATKASRVAEAARDRPVMEFGMRRAAGAGADAASRAALVGGAASTSNAAVGYATGIPPTGTHAHSMVQLFLALGNDEQDAFTAYADAYPDDCLLLVDTVDTLGSGVPNAIATFEGLRRRGHEPVGIRLDSGDLAHLAVRSARMLDDAGFPDTTIVLSSSLDELAIWQILTQVASEAPRAGLDADAVVGRLVFGVGSRLATSHGAPSLDGVYKLVAVDDGGTWAPAIKRSDTPEKVLNPGAKDLWRIYDIDGTATADVLATVEEAPTPGQALHLHHHGRPDVTRTIPADGWGEAEPLLERIVSGGEVVAVGGQEALDDVAAARARRRADVDRLDPGVRRLVNPHVYHVSITDGLAELRAGLLRAL